MIRAKDLLPFRTSAPDYHVSRGLKQLFAELRTSRTPFHLTGVEMEKIFRWKLGQQYGRGEHIRAENSESAYRIVSTAAFSVLETDLDYEAELRVRLLTSLRGVGVPVASAFLAMAEPAKYGVIDFRAWRTLFSEERKSFDVPAYIRYQRAIRPLAAELGWMIQEVDLAAWEFDRQRSGGAV